MIKTISRLSAVLGTFVLPVCFAAGSQPPTAQIQGTEYSVSVGDSTQRTSERLILAADDQDKKRQKEREDLKKKQMAEHQAREELRKKEMAERKAKEEQRRKEMTEHRAKEQERERERHKERAEHRGRDEHKAAGNVAPQTFAPPPPPPAPPSVPRQGFTSPQQAAPAVPAAPMQGLSAPQIVAPAVPAAPKQEVVAPQKAAPAPAAAAASPLTVRTYPASGIAGYQAGSITAMLNGYASYPGKVVRVWFEWGDSPSFGQGSTPAQSFTGDKSIGQNTIISLRKKKVYFRAIAESSGLLVYGETQSFLAP